jgi:hypothetical protein
VLHLLEEGDLADGGGRDALVVLLQPDLLERDRLVGVPVLALVHHPVRALPDLLHLLVLRPPPRTVVAPRYYSPRNGSEERGAEGKKQRGGRAGSPGPWRGDPRVVSAGDWRRRRGV